MVDSIAADDAPSATLTTATTDTNEVKPCRLLELPAELRNAIYLLALVHDDPILLSVDQENPVARPCKDRDEYYKLDLGTNILRTCKQIHDEATPILYGINRFCFDKHSEGLARHTAFEWLVRNSNNSVQYLREVTIEGHDSKEALKNFFTTLKRLGPKLSKLSIGPRFQYYIKPEEMALALRPLIRALDKKYKSDAGSEPSDILDRLELIPHPVEEEYHLRGAPAGQHPAAVAYRRALQVRSDAEYSIKVKATLREMLLKLEPKRVNSKG